MKISPFYKNNPNKEKIKFGFGLTYFYLVSIGMSLCIFCWWEGCLIGLPLIKLAEDLRKG